MNDISHIDSFRIALAQLDKALKYPPAVHELVMDGTIQRFEFCFELCWKSIREALANEGLEANSPKQAFIHALSLGWIKNEEDWLRILKDRNLTTHTYFIEMAEKVYGNISLHYQLMSNIAEYLANYNLKLKSIPNA